MTSVKFILLSTNKIMRLSASTSSIYSEPIRFLLPLLSLPKKQNIVPLSRVLRFCSTLPAAGCGFGTKSSASDTPVETREALERNSSSGPQRETQSRRLTATPAGRLASDQQHVRTRAPVTFACRGGAGRACATCLAACSLRDCDPLPAVSPRSDPLLSCSVKSGRAAKTCGKRCGRRSVQSVLLC